MHVIVALSPICTVVFFGRPFCKMGRDRGLAVEKMMGMFVKEIKYFSCCSIKSVRAERCGTSENLITVYLDDKIALLFHWFWEVHNRIHFYFAELTYNLQRVSVIYTSILIGHYASVFP